MHRIATQIHDHILAAEKVLLIPHQHPDGDTLGAVTAMMQYLTRIEKPHAAFCATEISEKLMFLSHAHRISRDAKTWDDPAIDTLVVFDSGDLVYAGVAEYAQKIKRPIAIINIDHHVTNTKYGQYNLVLTTASSTAEILYGFFRQNTIEVDPKMATSLLTGILTDTGNFTNAATHAGAMAIAGKLLACGANIGAIHTATIKDKTIQGIRAWGAVLDRMAHHAELDIVYTFVTQHDLQTYHVSDDEMEGLANFLNNIEEGRAGMILKEKEDGTVKGSFRTTKDDVDVAAWTKLFGGGGHKKAAGFTVAGPMDAAIQRVFETITRYEEKSKNKTDIEQMLKKY